MLMPKRVKWRKQQRGRMTGKELRGVEVVFGDLGLQALEPCWMTQRQIEAARRTVVHFVKRRGKMWVRVFPDKPVTKKAAETRMGKGKGAVDHYVAVIKPGRIMSGDRRRRRSHGARSAETGRLQAADQDADHRSA